MTRQAIVAAVSLSYVSSCIIACFCACSQRRFSWLVFYVITSFRYLAAATAMPLFDLPWLASSAPDRPINSTVQARAGNSIMHAIWFSLLIFFACRICSCRLCSGLTTRFILRWQSTRMATDKEEGRRKGRQEKGRERVAVSSNAQLPSCQTDRQTADR